MNYRKIWEKHYGVIPVDENGKTYEIHHIDGNRKNNDINNLVAISIKDHYEIHLKKGDYLAAHIINKRIKNSTEYIGWKHRESTKKKISIKNKGRKFSEDHKKNMSLCRLGRKRNPHSEETKEKIRQSKLGDKNPAKRKEVRDRISNTQKGRKIPSVVCPYCKKIGSNGAMQRWHFNNCKNKSYE